MSEPTIVAAEAVAFEPLFFQALGMFHANWSAVELATDVAIGQFMKVDDEDAHLITAGRMFGQKATLLVDLVRKSDHPQRAQIITAFSWLRGNAKRDHIAHSYILSDKTTVTFVNRRMSDRFQVNELSFTLEEFIHHCVELGKQSLALSTALGLTHDRLFDFSEAASNFQRKSSAAK